MTKEVSLDPESIPIWLQLSPDAVPCDVGPVITRPQELPFDRLTWENFERLCFRLVQREADVEHCQPYGTRGQDPARNRHLRQVALGHRVSRASMQAS